MGGKERRGEGGGFQNKMGSEEGDLGCDGEEIGVEVQQQGRGRGAGSEKGRKVWRDGVEV